MLQRESYWDKSLRFGRWWMKDEGRWRTDLHVHFKVLVVHTLYVRRVCVGVIETLFAETHHECSKGKCSIMFAAVVRMPPGEVPVSPCCKSCWNSCSTLQQPLHWTRTPLTLPLSGLNIHLDQQSQSTFQRNIAAVWARLSVIFTPDLGSRPVGPSQFALHTPVWSGRAAQFLLTQRGCGESEDLIWPPKGFSSLKGPVCQF